VEADAKAGAVLSHVEAVYRPADRDLAIALFEALGCKTHETGTPSLSSQSYVSVHPDPSVRGLDDVIYLSEMTSEQSRFDDILRQRIDADAELSAALANFRALSGLQGAGAGAGRAGGQAEH